MKILMLGLMFFFRLAAVADTAVPESVQAQILQFYTDGNCIEAQKLMFQYNLKKLRPNIMAIAASCEPLGYNPEELFTRAEELSPTGDLILVLHAKYRSLHDPKNADVIWEKVLMVARNTYFRELAKERLAGVLVDEKKEHPLKLSNYSFLGNAYFAGFYRRNPELSELAFENPRHSQGGVLGALFVYRRWYDFGSLAIRDNVIYESYGKASLFNFFNNSLEAPLAFHVASSKDLIFRPFLSYSELGGDSYHFIYGIGMKAAVYTSAHVQSVQGIFYNDRIYHSAINATGGAHYRFEFAWDFYPIFWTISTMFAAEHISGTNVSEFLGSIGSFDMSHNDLSLEFKFERELPHFGLEVSPKFRYRADTDDSRYVNRLGTLTTKQREDFEFSLKTMITVPLFQSVQFLSWYEWHNIYSNFGNFDFANFNYHNHTVGLGLRANFSSY